MDIFNKKKVKELENYNKILKADFAKLESKLQNVNNELIKEKNTSNIIMQQNEKLSSWIQGIMKIIGTMEVKEIEQIKIPIVKHERNYRTLDPECFREEHIEDIVIPKIIFSKSTFY